MGEVRDTMLVSIFDPLNYVNFVYYHKRWVQIMTSYDLYSISSNYNYNNVCVY